MISIAYETKGYGRIILCETHRRNCFMLLVKNGYMIDPRSQREGAFDLLLDHGKIVRIAQQGDLEDTVGPDAAVLDASRCIVAPGLVDTHAHFRDPGYPEKEDIHSGAAAAAAGGYTSIIMMANTNPPIDNTKVLERVLEKCAKEKIHIYSAANVTLHMQGKELTDFEALKEAGAKVFTDDGVPVRNRLLLRSALLHAKALDMPVSLHEEDPSLISENGINGGGAAAAYYGIKGSPREAEITMIREDVQAAAQTGAALCIQHISTAEGVALVRHARQINPLIRAEATPHHFSLTEEAVIRCGALAKVNPPVRTEHDRMEIIRGLQDGTISFIATDHAPHTAAQKAVTPLWKAPSGMIGLETALSLSIRELVNPGFLTMMQLLRLLTWNPAEYYKLPAGSIEEDGPADLVIFDPQAQWTVPDHFASRSSNSPFIGETLPGVVRWTIADGEIVYKNPQ